jgi:hypothetical protein
MSATFRAVRNWALSCKRLDFKVLMSLRVPGVILSGCSFLSGYYYYFIYFAVLGLELRAFTLSHATSPIFCDRVFFEIGSCKLFAWAGFEPHSS